MITPHTLQTESPTEELAVLLVGDYGAGKSYCAATSPGTVFYFDFDQRLNALRSHPNAKNIFGMTFADSTDTNIMPVAMNELLGVLSQLEKSPMLKDLHGSFAGNDRCIDTLVFDSIQTIADSARRYVLYNGGTGEGGITKAFVIGGKTYRVAKNWHGWGGEMEMVTGAILQARALLHCKVCSKSVTYRQVNGIGQLFHTDTATKFDHDPIPKAMNVICILHETMEEDERSTEQNPIYTGRIAVFPVRYRVLLKYFNEVWRLTREHGRIPTLTCDPDGKFTKAKTALGIDKITVPNIEQVLRDVKSLQKKQ
jgi:hypothetical protein